MDKLFYIKYKDELAKTMPESMHRFISVTEHIFRSDKSGYINGNLMGGKNVYMLFFNYGDLRMETTPRVIFRVSQNTLKMSFFACIPHECKKSMVKDFIVRIIRSVMALGDGVFDNKIEAMGYMEDLNESYDGFKSGYVNARGYTFFLENNDCDGEHRLYCIARNGINLMVNTNEYDPIQTYDLWKPKNKGKKFYVTGKVLEDYTRFGINHGCPYDCLAEVSCYHTTFFGKGYNSKYFFLYNREDFFGCIKKGMEGTFYGILNPPTENAEYYKYVKFNSDGCLLLSHVEA